MYDKDFWERAKIRNICGYIRNGVDIYYEINNIGDDEHEKDLKAEKMYVEIMDALGKSNDLAFDMGFVTGSKVMLEIANTARSDN